MVKDQDGLERPAEINTAMVNENERRALCGVQFADGRSAICEMPLSDEELRAWKRHPDTFFGTVGQRTTRAETPLEFYDFWVATFRRYTKDQLLNLMKQTGSIDSVQHLTKEELAKIHAEQMTNFAFSNRRM